MESSPIKGTARTAEELLPKDRDENVMIVDLVRNDLSRACEPGSIEVPSLLRVEEHPGLVHLVSTVRARLRPAAGWADLIAAAFPPGSVSGAPKSTALQAIADLETGAPRALLRSGRLGRRGPARRASSPWASAPSGPTPDEAIAGCCGSAPAPASPGARTRSWSGRRPS